jgi:hypothetical protein
MDEFLAFLDKYEAASSKTESEFTALLGKIEALKGEIEASSKSDSKFKVVLEKIESLNEETEASSKIDSESTTLLEMIGTSPETDSEYSALLERMKALEERRSKRMNAARPALVQVEHQAEAGGSGAGSLSSSRPITIATPPGTTAIYMSVMSLDSQFSSSKLSWVIDGRTYGMDFTRPAGAEDILVDAAFGLPIGAITKEMPKEITLLCSVNMPETARKLEPGIGPIIQGPVATPVGPAGDAFMVQVSFRRWISDRYIPDYTTVNILFQGAADGYVEEWPAQDAAPGEHHRFT